MLPKRGFAYPRGLTALPVSAHRASAAAVQRPVRAGRWFYVGGAILAIALSIAAFAPSIVNPVERRGPLTPLVVAHAAFVTMWLGLFLVQGWLAATRRLNAHRRLGVPAVAIAAGVVVTGYLATVAMARRGFDLSGDLSRNGRNALDQTVFQFGNLAIFSVLVSVALMLRHRPAAHKRLMTLALLQTLMAAPLAHLVGHFALPAVILPAWGVAVLAALIVHDRRTRGRIHPATLWAGLGFVVTVNVLALVVGPSETWRRVVAWLAG